METEKIFWALVVAVVVGAFAFMAFGALVSPVYAQQGQLSATSCGGARAAQLAAAPSGAQQAGGQQQAGALAAVQGGVQQVTLSVQGANYYPNPIRVKKGIPVKLVADINSMPGCSKSIVMPDFGVRKVLSANDNVIEFTPQQSGTFSFSCSMGMYRGTIVVEEADGSVAAFTGNAPKAAAGSCGGSGGGCGCGG
ncbi:MAG: cupredoxin domain-containing protein [Candidatus Micrarchaeia archaeon]|jgi:hypothetical protein